MVGPSSHDKGLQIWHICFFFWHETSKPDSFQTNDCGTWSPIWKHVFEGTHLQPWVTCKKKVSCLTLPGCMARELLQPQRFAVTIYRYKISVYIGGRGHQSYEMGSGIAWYLEDHPRTCKWLYRNTPVYKP